MTIVTLCLLAVSGYFVGLALTALIKAEEAMVAVGDRNWKILGRLFLWVLLAGAVAFGLMLAVALDETVTSDQIGIFGIATMALLAVPILRYRWQQMKKKKGDAR